SIDGMQATHDKIRGKSFEKIIENIKRYKNSKKIIANICISRLNVSEVGKMVRFLNDKVYGITVQFFYPYEMLPDYSLLRKEKKDVLNSLLLLKKSGYGILDSQSCLKNMADNTWICHDFLVSSVEKDGSISYGCYLKNKVEKISCADCGFAVHCEISLAYRFNISAIKSAARIFWGKI
ncbi:MAG: hypothetical protein M1308_12880, partial [Actinobacteria bacterium]|nr:hypothetical protein [Actinomycetota bacterium]